MTYVDMFGYSGLFFLALCWVPQTIATLKEGVITIRKSFLLLYLTGSILLLFQAIWLESIPLIMLNCFTTVSSSINLYYGLFPRITQ